jgi:hypothetical protein
MECPCVDRSFTPNEEFNTPIEYKNPDGSKYVFYSHYDGFGTYYNCQFCKLIGRKRDVFECLNENEWKECSYYKLRSKELSK